MWGWEQSRKGQGEARSNKAAQTPALKGHLAEKTRNRLPTELSPMAGQLPPASAHGHIARRPETAQNMIISEERLLTHSRADFESWKFPRRGTVLEKDSRTRQV